LNIHAHLPIDRRPASAPLFIALQGPQGSGKTTLTERVKEMLAENNEDHAPYKRLRFRSTASFPTPI
jgi:pantothenate kinase-related protein Tda10